MPHRVCVSEAGVQYVEEHAHRVGEAPRDEPKDACRLETLHQRHHCDEDQPAHAEPQPASVGAQDRLLARSLNDNLFRTLQRGQRWLAQLDLAPREDVSRSGQHNKRDTND